MRLHKNHKHQFVWYMINAGKKNSYKAIRCIYCLKSLDDVIEQIIQTVKKSAKVIK